MCDVGGGQVAVYFVGCMDGVDVISREVRAWGFGELNERDRGWKLGNRRRTLNRK